MMKPRSVGAGVARPANRSTVRSKVPHQNCTPLRPKNADAELLEDGVRRAEDAMEALCLLGLERVVVRVLREGRRVGDFLRLVPEVELETRSRQAPPGSRPRWRRRDGPARAGRSRADPVLVAIQSSPRKRSMPMVTTVERCGMAPVVKPCASRKRRTCSHSGWGGARASFVLPSIWATRCSVFLVGAHSSYGSAGQLVCSIRVLLVGPRGPSARGLDCCSARPERPRHRPRLVSRRRRGPTASPVLRGASPHTGGPGLKDLPSGARCKVAASTKWGRHGRRSCCHTLPRPRRLVEYRLPP